MKPAANGAPGPLALVIDSGMHEVHKAPYRRRGALFRTTSQVLAMDQVPLTVMRIWIDASIDAGDREKLEHKIDGHEAIVHRDSSSIPKLAGVLERNLPPEPEPQSPPPRPQTDETGLDRLKRELQQVRVYLEQALEREQSALSRTRELEGENSRLERLTRTARPAPQPPDLSGDVTALTANLAKATQKNQTLEQEVRELRSKLEGDSPTLRALKIKSAARAVKMRAIRKRLADSLWNLRSLRRDSEAMHLLRTQDADEAAATDSEIKRLRTRLAGTLWHLRHVERQVGIPDPQIEQLEGILARQRQSAAEAMRDLESRNRSLTAEVYTLNRQVTNQKKLEAKLAEEVARADGEARTAAEFTDLFTDIAELTDTQGSELSALLDHLASANSHNKRPTNLAVSRAIAQARKITLRLKGIQIQITDWISPKRRKSR